MLIHLNLVLVSPSCCVHQPANRLHSYWCVYRVCAASLCLSLCCILGMCHCSFKTSLSFTLLLLAVSVHSRLNKASIILSRLSLSFTEGHPVTIKKKRIFKRISSSRKVLHVLQAQPNECQ